MPFWDRMVTIRDLKRVLAAHDAQIKRYQVRGEGTAGKCDRLDRGNGNRSGCRR